MGDLTTQVLPLPGTAGQILRDNGSAWVASTAKYPNTAPVNEVMHAVTANNWSSRASFTFDGATLQVAADTAGAGTMARILENLDNTNAASFATDTIKVGGASAGDPGTVWTVSGVTSFKAGIDNSDSDKWKLSIGTALGTSDAITVDTAGQINLPLQPAFFAFKSANTANVTGDGTLYTVICDTEVFDQNADYNNATGVFTAPVTGRYPMCARVESIGNTAANTGFELNVVTSNRTYIKEMSLNSPSGTLSEQLADVMDFDAGDTAFITLKISGSTKTSSAYGVGSAATTFSGHLAC